jgi:hypothetical protein
VEVELTSGFGLFQIATASSGNPTPVLSLNGTGQLLNRFANVLQRYNTVVRALHLRIQNPLSVGRNCERRTTSPDSTSVAQTEDRGQCVACEIKTFYSRRMGLDIYFWAMRHTRFSA